MELWVGVIAVVGTLLGAVVSHSLQSRTARRLHTEALSAETRRELRQAAARLLAAETVLRRLQYDRWAARNAALTERNAADSAALAARSDVIAALAEVQLLTEDGEVRERLADLADATFTLHQASDEEDLATRSHRARAAADGVVDTVGRLIRS